jgi:signal transduction histidine kinase
MEHQSRIVIGPDGTVLAATGDVPPGLVDVRLEDCDALSPEVREAGKALLEELRRSGERFLSHTLTLAGGARSLQLVAIEALAIRRSMTDLRELVPSKLAVISWQATAVGVELSIHIADEVPPSVALDAEKVAWAVTTLVGNALRYVQSGSGSFSGSAIDVRVSHDPVASEVTIEVQDDGPGIPADTIARLFKRDGLIVRGSGLALLLVRDIVAAHGGTVDVCSNTASVGHGTTIRLTFPSP